MLRPQNAHIEEGRWTRQSPRKNNLLVLEYNKSVCNEMYWKEIFIQDKDQIEIITIVGGG